MTATVGLAIVIVVAAGLLAGACLWAAGVYALATMRAIRALREGDDQC